MKMDFDHFKAVHFMEWFTKVYCENNPFDWSRDFRKPMCEIKQKLYRKEITDIRSFLVELEKIGFLSHALENFHPDRINQMRGIE